MLFSAFSLPRSKSALTRFELLVVTEGVEHPPRPRNLYVQKLLPGRFEALAGVYVNALHADLETSGKSD